MDPLLSDFGSSPCLLISRGEILGLSDPPARHFSVLVVNKALPPIDACVALAWRLGGPWATLGPPKGHPNPDPIPMNRQRVATFRIWLIADC
jgi:hypothetical protein